MFLDIFLRRIETPEEIESKNIAFFRRDREDAEKTATEINDYLQENCELPEKCRISVKVIYYEGKTHVNQYKTKEVVRLQIKIEWKSPREFYYAEWYEFVREEYKLNKNRFLKFITDDFVPMSLNKWTEIDPIRIH
jgi:hypothetical protein